MKLNQIYRLIFIQLILQKYAKKKIYFNNMQVICTVFKINTTECQKSD